MKNNSGRTRREFLVSAGALSGSTLLRLSATSTIALIEAACTARDRQANFDILGVDEAADLAAIIARILPTTETIGATEAGVIYFFDKALGAEMSEMLDDVRAGLEHLNESIKPVNGFAQLSAEEQDDQLRGIETTPFFSLLWEMTIYGFFAMSESGGNKDHVAWDLIGFKGHNGGWQYPFGYYDAQVHAGPDDDE